MVEEGQHSSVGNFNMLKAVSHRAAEYPSMTRLCQGYKQGVQAATGGGGDGLMPLGLQHAQQRLDVRRPRRDSDLV